MRTLTVLLVGVLVCVAMAPGAMARDPQAHEEVAGDADGVSGLKDGESAKSVTTEASAVEGSTKTKNMGWAELFRLQPAYQWWLRLLVRHG